jgi:fructoselysine-6-phosphate deglycase
MLNFDEARFVAIQSGAVGLAEGLREAVAGWAAGGGENVFFLGTGGAGLLMFPAARLLQAHSTLPVFVDWAAEITLAGSAQLGPRSLVVIPSLSGTTAESLAVAGYARQAGATIIALTGEPDSPLARAADHNFSNVAADDTSSESFYLQSLILALALMAERGEFGSYDATLAELRRLPELLVGVKQAAEKQAAQLAATIAGQPYHIVTGAGSAWAEAFYYGMCILEEMQWIRTRPVHAADFFHGTLELVEEGVSVLLLKGEDPARPLADRVEAFVPRHGGRLTVIDTAAYELPDITPEVRALISPVLLATILERVSAHLEVLTEHPLTTRRYYKQEQY